MCHYYICLSFPSEADYRACVDDVARYREFLTIQQAAHPELFPAAPTDGYTFHRAYELRKLGVVVRRIKLKTTGQVFTLRPSFVLPYGVARTDTVEKALYLRQFGVPFDEAGTGYRCTVELSPLWATLASPSTRPGLAGSRCEWVCLSHKLAP